jgi:tetratricopeptide (TPR) repeat protein
MRRIVLGCTAVAVLVLVAQRAPAQMCQHRGGSMAAGRFSYPMNMPYYTPGYASYYPNYYPGYYPTNYYPNYYPGTYPNATAAAAQWNGTGGPQRDASDLIERGTLAKAKSKLRTSDPKSKAKAEKLIAAGDEAFGKQKYSSAVEQYKSAARLAPEAAEPCMREGFALVAAKRYVAAVKAFRRGLAIRPDWTDSPLRLDQLYAEDAMAKTNQALTKALELKPADADLLVAQGMQLYFDGQRDRAGTFFARAAGLGANRDRLLDDFLPSPALAEVSKDKR